MPSRGGGVGEGGWWVGEHGLEEEDTHMSLMAAEQPESGRANM